jgi:hypothetical protein
VNEVGRNRLAQRGREEHAREQTEDDEESWLHFVSVVDEAPGEEISEHSRIHNIHRREVVWSLAWQREQARLPNDHSTVQPSFASRPDADMALKCPWAITDAAAVVAVRMDLDNPWVAGYQGRMRNAEQNAGVTLEMGKVEGDGALVVFDMYDCGVALERIPPHDVSTSGPPFLPHRAPPKTSQTKTWRHDAVVETLLPLPGSIWTNWQSILSSEEVKENPANALVERPKDGGVVGVVPLDCQMDGGNFGRRKSGNVVGVAVDDSAVFDMQKGVVLSPSVVLNLDRFLQ